MNNNKLGWTLLLSILVAFMLTHVLASTTVLSLVLLLNMGVGLNLLDSKKG